MKIMVVGGGGREHAIIRKLRENPSVTEIFALPGNAGIAQDATCVNVKATDIDGIVNFSQAPLSIASMAGLAFTIISFLMILFIVVRKLIFGDPVAGWASTIYIILFIGGVQLLCMGIIGQYLAKTYLEVKRRPHYIVAEASDREIERVR